MATEEIHVADVGTQLIFTVKDGSVVVNLSGATVKKIRIQRKDRTIIDVDATLLTDGTDGKLYYILTDTDVTMKGDYKAQVYLEFPSGKWHSSISTFTVAENIKD